MSVLESITFPVSGVEPARSPLGEVSRKVAVEALLNSPVFERGSGSSEAAQVESCYRYHGRLVADVTFHPVIAALETAFQSHRPVRLSPDAIWLMICQAVANHVNANAEALRSRFVRHEGKEKIQLKRNDFIKGSPENPWDEVIGEFSAKVREQVGPMVDRFVPDFSTTGPIERTAAEIVLLHAMQSYFEYEFLTVCGIPSITLEGTADDWDRLAQRAERFADLGLEGWMSVLRPILNQFSRAARGDVETTFWQSIYKFNSQSGSPIITGWIVALFPYWQDARTRRATTPVPEILNPSTSLLEDPSYLDKHKGGFRMRHRHLPPGLSAAPFRWKYLNSEYEMAFLGGFVGVSQDPESLTLRPEIGWAVQDMTNVPVPRT